MAYMYEVLAMSLKKELPDKAVAHFRKAAELYEETYASMRRVLDEKDEAPLSILRCLGAVYRELGDHQRATEAYGEEFRFRCKVFGEEEYDTAGPLYVLANTCGEAGEHRRSAELFSLLRSLYYIIKGPADWCTLNALDLTAEQFSLMGDHQMAAELYSEEYTLYLQETGEDSRSTQNVLKRLNEEKAKLSAADETKDKEIRIDLYAQAFEAHSTGDVNAAIALYTQTYNFRCDVLGADHPFTLFVLDKLAECNAEVKENSDIT
jgi:hypothetical protein